MVATRVVCARFGGEDGRRLGGELAHGLRGWAELRRLYRGRCPLPSPPPLRASPCRGGGRTAGDWAVVGEWFAGMVGVSGRWWWGKPHPTGLYEHRRLHRGRYPLPSPPPLRASPCRGGGSSVVVWHFGCFLLLGMNGRSTRVVCFVSVGKQANPTPTLHRFPRKCERIFVGAHPQGEGAERREIGQ